MMVETEDIPLVSDEERLEIQELGNGFLTIPARYGFMEQPNVMRALVQCARQKLHFNPMDTSFVIGRDKLRAGNRPSPLSRWRKALFILMSNNAADATEFFAIPVNRVVELGAQVEI
jgi:KUP system potassium uptake protein